MYYYPALGSSGAWVVQGHNLCGHVVAIREDVPWAYMSPIGPIIDDIKRKLNTDDVKLFGSRIDESDFAMSPPSNIHRPQEIGNEYQAPIFFSDGQVSAEAKLPYGPERSSQSRLKLQQISKLNPPSIGRLHGATLQEAGRVVPDQQENDTLDKKPLKFPEASSISDNANRSCLMWSQHGSTQNHSVVSRGSLPSETPSATSEVQINESGSLGKPTHDNERPESCSEGHRNVPHAMEAFLEEGINDTISSDVAANTGLLGPQVRHNTITYFTTGTSILSNGGSSGPPSLASLTNGSYSTTTSSITTRRGARENPYVLHFDERNIPVVLPYNGQVIYDCPFDKLSCLLTFQSVEDWHNHSMTHFNNGQRFDPPTRNKCPFCDGVFTASNGYRSWKLRMNHVGLHHQNGQRLTRTGRIDPELYRHLWMHKVINELEFKDITGGGHTSRYTEDPTPAYSLPSKISTSNSEAVTERSRVRFQRPGRSGEGDDRHRPLEQTWLNLGI